MDAPLTAGDEVPIGSSGRLVNGYASYAAIVDRGTDQPGVPVVMVDVYFADDDEKVRLILEEQAARDMMIGVGNSLDMLANLRKDRD